jgi:hypothetical protein
MTYPKPLSEKSLRKLYAEAGITDIESEFLHALFQSCANLYGVISVQDIYHFGKSTTPDRPDQTWVNCLNLFVAGYTV